MRTKFMKSRAMFLATGEISGRVYWIPLLRLNLRWLRDLLHVNRDNKAKPYLCPHSRNSHEGRHKEQKTPEKDAHYKFDSGVQRWMHCGTRSVHRNMQTGHARLGTPLRLAVKLFEAKSTT
ncbi:PREDICTED: uncharacterized protein LOC105148655 [Acromyrmex echinatior]|uniref:uncharacterized protein LOC105148655 n=1 Tax=Acromyrmex echinatior TaxID=103372 RepID=UPI000580BC9B|nr:PREDICTED: uncharacterized protein LOC105148655 [Acromyrmex echinatior]